MLRALERTLSALQEDPGIGLVHAVSNWIQTRQAIEVALAPEREQVNIRGRCRDFLDVINTRIMAHTRTDLPFTSVTVWTRLSVNGDDERPLLEGMMKHRFPQRENLVLQQRSAEESGRTPERTHVRTLRFSDGFIIMGGPLRTQYLASVCTTGLTRTYFTLSCIWSERAQMLWDRMVMMIMAPGEVSAMEMMITAPGSAMEMLHSFHRITAIMTTTVTQMVCPVRFCGLGIGDFREDFWTYVVALFHGGRRERVQPSQRMRKRMEHLFLTQGHTINWREDHFVWELADTHMWVILQRDPVNGDGFLMARTNAQAEVIEPWNVTSTRNNQIAFERRGEAITSDERELKGLYILVEHK